MTRVRDNFIIPTPPTGVDPEDIVQTLRELRLRGMADMAELMADMPDLYEDWTWLERLWSMVSSEVDRRLSNKVANNLKNAKLRFPMASLDSITHLEERNLDAAYLKKLSNGQWMENGKENLIITGPAGSGKTYVSCALAVSICTLGHPVRYTRTDDLMREMQDARLAGTYEKVLQKYTKIPLLILDDFLIAELNETQTVDLLNLVERRYLSSSLLICTQFSIDEWIDRMCVSESQTPLCEAIMDRIAYNSKELNIGGEVSMRERLSPIRRAEK